MLPEMFTRGLCVRVVAVAVADDTSPMKIILSASVVLLVNNRVLAKAVVFQSVIESWLRTLPLTLLTTIVASSDCTGLMHERYSMCCVVCMRRATAADRVATRPASRLIPFRHTLGRGSHGQTACLAD